MILVDTSVWVQHFRKGFAPLAELLLDGDVACHPFVAGELACGNLRSRRNVLSLLASLPRLPVAGHDEVLTLIEVHRLMGTGLGWVDVHLLASALISGCRLWSLDARLRDTAGRLGAGFAP
ncbi:MAG: PIN domain-containing protein [Planctomycetes bacterium]|nr:PIN domain-containing protein [Planctomycetota bacterium]